MGYDSPFRSCQELSSHRGLPDSLRWVNRLRGEVFDQGFLCVAFLTSFSAT